MPAAKPEKVGSEKARPERELNVNKLVTKGTATNGASGH